MRLEPSICWPLFGSRLMLFVCCSPLFCVVLVAATLAGRACRMNEHQSRADTRLALSKGHQDHDRISTTTRKLDNPNEPVTSCNSGHPFPFDSILFLRSHWSPRPQVHLSLWLVAGAQIGDNREKQASFVVALFSPPPFKSNQVDSSTRLEKQQHKTDKLEDIIICCCSSSCSCSCYVSGEEREPTARQTTSSSNLFSFALCVVVPPLDLAGWLVYGEHVARVPVAKHTNKQLPSI